MSATEDPLSPRASLLAKLASFVVHVEESSGKQGHEFDIAALRSLAIDPEIQVWIKEMSLIGMAPLKR
jgi:hypothetical protein